MQTPASNINRQTLVFLKDELRNMTCMRFFFYVLLVSFPNLEKCILSQIRQRDRMGKMC